MPYNQTQTVSFRTIPVPFHSTLLYSTALHPLYLSPRFGPIIYQHKKYNVPTAVTFCMSDYEDHVPTFYSPSEPLDRLSSQSNDSFSY